MTNSELLLRLLLQLTVILSVCRVVSYFGKRYLGQTDVVGEMLAGIMLGPSLFGVIAPDLQQWLFPKIPIIGGASQLFPNPSMSILYALSNVGLMIYMFLVGLELNTDLLRNRAKSAGLVSIAGIIFPFILGAIAALGLFGGGDLFSPNITPWAAALYMGASMSITAFPMLARILQEKGLIKTQLGTLVLAAGSLDDAVAWCLLALVLASIKSSINVAIIAIGGTLLYVMFMWFAGRRLLRFFSYWTRRDGEVTLQTLTFVLIIMMLCAFYTDFIGVHAVFGAFVLGTVMPRGHFAESVHRHLEYLTSSLLVPIFFVFSGLNTQLGLINTPQLLALTVLIIAIATCGKGIACTLAAKQSGETWRSSLTVGALMNTRGMMELIILNIGLEQGLITPTLFSIMVIMAIFTTVMCSPLVNFLIEK
ncbi:cation:proton antiporter [Pseudanabaena sp. FACHB-1998]|uniref:cation:proton antiporter n=1 Tax=Pseudanabaena sp. FACHB-1998 TaxID=2692858 RepID=UPI0016813C2C|nr:cation:proton antiporter [Pseudanabaena sp. FACHB-1998]MBD2179084.1 cation:proton antiporter [Pseudanabaena sp. FACHB-1998]